MERKKRPGAMRERELEREKEAMGSRGGQGWGGGEGRAWRWLKRGGLEAGEGKGKAGKVVGVAEGTEEKEEVR